jgi:uncharacterized membrane protein YedE/YeeE
MRIFTQFLIGLLFGTGLIIAGMANPAKVLNFLDVAGIASGTWDASLGFVMAGAVAVTFIGYRRALSQPQPLLDPKFHLLRKKHIDAPLIAGSALFGLGWGLTGFCPGPAFVWLGTQPYSALPFIAAMMAGMAGARWLALRAIQRGRASRAGP